MSDGRFFPRKTAAAEQAEAPKASNRGSSGNRKKAVVTRFANERAIETAAEKEHLMANSGGTKKRSRPRIAIRPTATTKKRTAAKKATTKRRKKKT
jgi:hypothetical protein